MEQDKLNLIIESLSNIQKQLGDQEKRLTNLESAKSSADSVVDNSMITADFEMSALSNSPIEPEVEKTKELPQVKVHNEAQTAKILGGLGIGAIVVGVAFFLQYAWDYMDVQVRVIIGFIIGLGLVVGGNFIKKKYLRYGNLLSGGGLAILYLTIFYAKQMSVVSPIMSLSLMSIVTVLSGVLSILGGTPVLAFVGIVGGFASPFLVGGSGIGLPVLLSYVLFLDLAIAVISIYKKWDYLNFIGFIGTVFVGSFSIIGSSSLELGNFSKLGFLTAYFILYLITSTVHSVVRKEKTSDSDIALTTLNGFAYFASSLFILSLAGWSELRGFFTVALALIYFGLAFFVRQRNKKDDSLNLYLPFLSVVFLTISIPLQFSGPWITVAWLVEAVALYGLFRTSGQKIFATFGGLVYSAGVARLIMFENNFSLTYNIILNPRFILYLFAILAAYFISSIYYQKKSVNSAFLQMAGFFLVLANILTLTALTLEVNTHYRVKQAQFQQTINESMQRDYSYRSEGGLVDNDQYYRQLNLNKEKSDSTRNTVISVIWAIYAIILIAIGFTRRQKIFRNLGVILFVITAVLIFMIVWELGSFYRIISTIIFGILALLSYFAYVKFEDKLENIN